MVDDRVILEQESERYARPSEPSDEEGVLVKANLMATAFMPDKNNPYIVFTGIPIDRIVSGLYRGRYRRPRPSAGQRSGPLRKCRSSRTTLQRVGRHSASRGGEELPDLNIRRTSPKKLRIEGGETLETAGER